MKLEELLSEEDKKNIKKIETEIGQLGCQEIIFNLGGELGKRIELFTIFFHKYERIEKLRKKSEQREKRGEKFLYTKSDIVYVIIFLIKIQILVTSLKRQCENITNIEDEINIINIMKDELKRDIGEPKIVHSVIMGGESIERKSETIGNIFGVIANNLEKLRDKIIIKIKK
jgi:hypothetical protein